MLKTMNNLQLIRQNQPSLVLDLAALVYFRRHLRQKKTMRVIATCVCGLLAALLLLYLALAAMLLFAASQN